MFCSFSSGVHLDIFQVQLCSQLKLAAFQGIVQNGWQGLTFIAMDLLKPFGMQYAAAVEVSWVQCSVIQIQFNFSV